MLLGGLIPSCGFIAAHELQQHQYLMVHFFGAWPGCFFSPLAGRKNKLVVDREKVDGGSPRVAGPVLEGLS